MDIPYILKQALISSIADIAAARGGTALFKGGMAEAVVSGLFVRIGKHLVGLSQLLELLFRGRIVRIAVRVVLQGQLAVGLLDLIISGVLGNAQDLV